MGRIVGSVLAGYATMFVGVIALFAVAWMMLGPEGSFQGNTWNPSFTWVILSVVIGLVGAIAGGYVCQAIAKDARGIIGLLAVVIGLGLVMAVMAALAPDAASQTRPGAVSMFEAMNNGNQPVWLAFANPFIGAVGVLMGARLRGSAAV